MKTVDQMEHDELLALTDEDIERLIWRAMAEEGIPIVPAPIEPEYLPETGPTLHVFEVGNYNFLEESAARRVMDAINREFAHRVVPRYDYSIGYNAQTVEKADDEIKVSVRSFYTQEDFAAQRDALTENARRKKEYDKDKQEHATADRKAKDVVEHIRSTVNAAKDAERDRLRLRDSFLSYRNIAEGDGFLAIQFMRKAFDLPEEDVAWLAREFQISWDLDKEDPAHD